MVLERSVQTLLRDERVDVDVLPAMSFLDLAWARLGIDPVEAGVQLVDAYEFATRCAVIDRPVADRPHPRRTGCSPTSSWPPSTPAATSRW